MTIGDRMNDFGFEVVSKSEEEIDEAASDYEAMLEAKADEILRELRGS